MEEVAVIDCCGEYPNVPLLGIRGELPIILVWPYDSLGELGGTDLMSCCFRTLSLTSWGMLRDIAADSYELGTGCTGLIRMS